MTRQPVMFNTSGRTVKRSLRWSNTSRQITLEASEVDNCLDEDGVVADVGIFALQLGQRAEERAPAGDVHLADGPLEGRGSDIRPEGVYDVLAVALVQQHEGDLERTGRQKGRREEAHGQWLRKQD